MQETLLAALAGEGSLRRPRRTCAPGSPGSSSTRSSTPSAARPAKPLPTDGRVRRPLQPARSLDRSTAERGRTPTPRSPEALPRGARACLPRLPEQSIAQDFMMREHLGLETATICKELGISATAWVTSCIAPAWRCACAWKRTGSENHDPVLQGIHPPAVARPRTASSTSASGSRCACTSRSARAARTSTSRSVFCAKAMRELEDKSSQDRRCARCGSAVPLRAPGGRTDCWCESPAAARAGTRPRLPLPSAASEQELTERTWRGPRSRRARRGARRRRRRRW